MLKAVTSSVHNLFYHTYESNLLNGILVVDSRGTLACKVDLDLNSQNLSVQAGSETPWDSMEPISRSPTCSHEVSHPEILDYRNESKGKSISTHPSQLERDARAFVEEASVYGKEKEKAALSMDFVSEKKCLQVCSIIS